MAKYKVYITQDAEQDIGLITDYLVAEESVDRALAIYSGISDTINSLSENPERGHFPGELKAYGIKSFREIDYKCYRIIYEIIDASVFVHVCADGRRDFVTLLNNRLFR